MTKIKDTVEVFTDQFGVPHVFANNEKDLFLVAGYISARERLFQMSMVLNAFGESWPLSWETNIFLQIFIYVHGGFMMFQKK